MRTKRSQMFTLQNSGLYSFCIVIRSQIKLGTELSLYKCSTVTQILQHYVELLMQEIMGGTFSLALYNYVPFCLIPGSGPLVRGAASPPVNR